MILITKAKIFDQTIICVINENLIVFNNKKYINYMGISILFENSKIDIDQQFLHEIRNIFTDLIINNITEVQSNINSIENNLLKY